jgi:glutathione S-transferase
MLTLWGRTNSLNVQKVLWALAEIGLDYKRIDAGMKYGVNDTPEYLARNPNGLVPTVDDDGFVLWESNVIVRYLAATYGSGSLLPQSVADRLVAEQWMDWQQSAVNRDLRPVFHQLVRTPPGERDPGVVEAGCRGMNKWVRILDGHLAARDFILGNRFTMADIPAGTAFYRWYALPVERTSSPAVERWLKRLGERSGFAAHVALPLS